MKITFHGAAKTVTGSQHLIEVNGRRILLECGLFQGKRKEAFELNRKGVPFSEAAAIDVVILSHAHIDHSGNLPCLVKNGFSGDIYATPATRDLCAIMLMDSANIQVRDVLYVNKKRRKNRQNEFEPLYLPTDVTRTMRQFIGLGYHRRHEILPGIFLTFVDAGHMLGSSHVVLDIKDSETNRDLRLVFSGDIGRVGIPIIRDPEPITDGCDVLLMESTYGNRSHPPYPESDRELERIVNETADRGGCLLLPAFSVGRTQQLVHSLHKLHAARKIPFLPVFVDSPLATNVTGIFRLHPEIYDEETLRFMEDTGGSAFSFSSLRFTRSVEESKRLNAMQTPAIIIAASGMMEHGRILHHLRSRIADPKNTILVTGWQAPYTLGRQIVEGEKMVKLFGELFPVAAKVEVLTGFSGHADREELVLWAGAMRKKPRHTFLVHGEEEAAATLKTKLADNLSFQNIVIPELHQAAHI